MNRLLLTGCVAALALLPGLLYAGVKDDMGNMFGSTMYHAQGPNASMSQRRGLISGGGIVVRNRSVNVGPLVAMEPPYINAGGCGGFDVNFGAISHISSDGIKQLLESVPSAAASYAFELGMSSISPQIHSIISKYANLVNDLGSKYGSSCEIAKAIVEGTMGESLRQGSQNLGARLATYNDQFAATTTPDSDETAGEKVAEANPMQMAKMQSGNVVWRALKLASADGWVPNGDANLLQDIMSLTGTYIACFPKTPGCVANAASAGDEGSGEGSNDGGPRIVYRPPMLNLLTLVNGSESGTPIRVWRCKGGTGPEQCLDLDDPEQQIEPMREKVLQVLRGDVGNLSDGIIGHVRSGTTPTENEKAFLVNSGKFGGIVLFLARYDAKEAEDFAEAYASLIAANMVKGYFDQLLQAAELSVGLNVNEPAREKGIEVVHEARQRLMRDFELITSQGDKLNEMLTYYSNLRESVLQSYAAANPNPGASR